MSLAWAIGAFVLAVAFLTILMRLAARLAGKAAGAGASRHFRDAEYIIEHKRLPGVWEKELALLSEEERPSALAAKRAELVRFFRTAPVFEDEETRRELLNRLTRITASFQERVV